jgi:hypothetical protein
MQKIFLALLVAIWLSSCASARKDIYFRSRLPTIENLDLNESKHWGLSMEAENKRFNAKATDDLTSRFHFRTDYTSLQEGGDYNLKGADLQLSYADRIQSVWPIQFSLSFDQLELKVGLFDFRNDGLGWKGIINTGYYKTASYQEEGGCSFICFSSHADRDKVSATQDNIDVSSGGAEKKVGGSIGYFFKKNMAAYVGYDWMNYDIHASATKKDTGDSINFDQVFYGSGYGAGILYYVNEALPMSLSVQHVNIYWVGETYETTLVNYSVLFGF